MDVKEQWTRPTLQLRWLDGIRNALSIVVGQAKDHTLWKRLVVWRLGQIVIVLKIILGFFPEHVPSVAPTPKMNEFSTKLIQKLQ